MQTFVKSNPILIGQVWQLVEFKMHVAQLVLHSEQVIKFASKYCPEAHKQDPEVNVATAKQLLH